MNRRLVAITIALLVLITLVVVINYTYVRPHPLHCADWHCITERFRYFTSLDLGRTH